MPPFLQGGNISSKTVSRVLYFVAKVSIINLICTLLHSLNDLPILKSLERGSEQLRVQDLFGLSTPEVYRNPGRPEKP